MKGIFVNSDGCVPYAEAIVHGFKPVETRNRNMLRRLVGERVAVVRTRRGKHPTIVGYVTITHAVKMTGEWLDANRGKTLIPEGSKYDSGDKPKWCYFLKDAETCDPYPLPANAVRHGISWCEW